LTDLDIVKRIRAGHMKAYADLITRYESAVYGVFLQVGMDADEAIRRTQDVFAEGYLHLGNVGKEADVVRAFFRILVAKLPKESPNWYRNARKLPENEQISLILRQIFNLSYEEIGEKMAISREKVAELLLSAREALIGELPSGDPCDTYRQMMPYYLDNEMSRA